MSNCAWRIERVSDSGRILPFGEREALLCDPLHVPDPKGRRDAMIAATALAHGMVLVTRNVRDFEGMGVRLLDPWLHR